MFGNYLIGLREGLEAALVVSILLAYLVKSGRRDRIRSIWIGVAAAVTVSVGAGAALTITSAELSHSAEEAFAGILSVVAVALVTWMIFWMRSAARSLKSELHERVDTALAAGATALAVTAAVAVGREGLETSLFLWSAIQATGQTLIPLLGAILGIGTAIVLTWLLYRRAISINLAHFFTWTGGALIIVAAGVLAHGVHDLQEAGILPGEDLHAFDIRGLIPPESWYGTLLRGTLNFNAAASWGEVLVWFAYTIPVMWLFLAPLRNRRPTPQPV